MRLQALVGASAIALMSSSAAAQGGIRLSVDGSIYSTSSITTSIDRDPFGPSGTELDSTFSVAGVFNSFGARLGYVADQSFVIGLYGAFGSQTGGFDDDPDTEATIARYAVAPFVEYAFLKGGDVRPGIEAFFGYAGTSQSQGTRDATTFGAFLVGANLRLHLFATETFSISPFVGVDYATGSVDVGSASADQHWFTVGFGVSVAGWIPLAPAAPDAPAAPSEAPFRDTASAPAVAPPAGPAASSAPPPPAEPWGALRRMIALGPSVTLVLLGMPDRDPSRVDLHLRSITSRPQLSSCTQFRIGGTQGTPMTAVQHGVTQTDAGLLEVLAGSTSIESLEGLAQEPQPALIVCGREARLDASAVAVLSAFIHEFRASAGSEAADIPEFEGGPETSAPEDSAMPPGGP